MSVHQRLLTYTHNYKKPQGERRLNSSSVDQMSQLGVYFIKNIQIHITDMSVLTYVEKAIFAYVYSYMEIIKNVHIK